MATTTTTGTGAGADKRKAETSPGFELSQPRLRRRGSMPDLQETSECKKSFSLPDLMKKGFHDPDIVKSIVPSIVPSIMHNIQPQITETIETTLKTSLSATIAKAVDEAIVKFQHSVMKPLMDQRDQEIELLKSDMKRKDGKITFLESKVAKLERSLNDLDQYGRRQSIRLNNVNLPETSECEAVVLELLNNALTEGEPFTSSDIERCHPIGKSNKNGKRQVIVKFQSYKMKVRAYAARFNLRNVYMTEDFSQRNQVIISKLVRLKKAKKVFKFWSMDGKIYAKAHTLQPKVRINCETDIDTMITDAVNEGYMSAMDNEVTMLGLASSETDNNFMI